VIAIATERAARAGVLVKDRLSLERMRTVGVVLFDKTGTLTKGEPAVSRVATDYNKDDLLALAAAVETDSEHPLARAIVHAASARLPAGENPNTRRSGVPFDHWPRRTGRRRRSHRVSRRPGHAAGLNVPVLQTLSKRAAPWAGRGASILHIVHDGEVLGAIALEDLHPACLA
jgi:Cu2+-exporting ATPase